MTLAQRAFDLSRRLKAPIIVRIRDGQVEIRNCATKELIEVLPMSLPITSSETSNLDRVPGPPVEAEQRPMASLKLRTIAYTNWHGGRVLAVLAVALFVVLLLSVTLPKTGEASIVSMPTKATRPTFVKVLADPGKNPKLHNMETRFEPGERITWHLPSHGFTSGALSLAPYVGSRDGQRWIRLMMRLTWPPETRAIQPSVLTLYIDDSEYRMYVDKRQEVDVRFGMDGSSSSTYDFALSADLVREIASAKTVTLRAEGSDGARAFQIRPEGIDRWGDVLACFDSLPGREIDTTTAEIPHITTRAIAWE